MLACPPHFASNSVKFLRRGPEYGPILVEQCFGERRSGHYGRQLLERLRDSKKQEMLYGKQKNKHIR